MKKKIFNFLLSAVFIFILINILISIIWPTLTDFRMKSKTFYSNEKLELIQITPEEQFEFYKEMWNYRKFNYVQFVQGYEKTKKNQKYVNVNIENGRKIENNNNCIRNFIFYGSSQTFGYNVKDNQTIAAYFKKILDKNYKNYCVYNFGSASHFSTQETIFFITHVLKNKAKKNDFIFFLDGMTEFGNKKTRISHNIEKLYDYFNLKYWDKYYFATSLLFESLPLVQLYKRIKTKKSENSNLNQKVSDDLKEETRQVFQKNILIRKGICQELEINCNTFLIPAPLSFKKNYAWKYELLKKVENIVDISSLLINQEKISYIDDVHYSPIASNKIANSIFSNIKNDIK